MQYSSFWEILGPYQRVSITLQKSWSEGKFISKGFSLYVFDLLPTGQAGKPEN